MNRLRGTRERTFYIIVCCFIVGMLLIAHSEIHAAGLDTLAEVGRAQGRMQKVLREETEVYEDLKRAIEDDILREGTAQKDIRERYGCPVVVLSEENGGEIWVYKPGYASHFEHRKIRLFFDDKKILRKIDW